MELFCISSNVICEHCRVFCRRTRMSLIILVFLKNWFYFSISVCHFVKSVGVFTSQTLHNTRMAVLPTLLTHALEINTNQLNLQSSLSHQHLIQHLLTSLYANKKRKLQIYGNTKLTMMPILPMLYIWLADCKFVTDVLTQVRYTMSLDNFKAATLDCPKHFGDSFCHRNDHTHNIWGL